MKLLHTLKGGKELEIVDYHDLLAKLGEGSAHPGGFTATVQLIDSLSLPAHGQVLEVGCGTGRTACYLARNGYRVTAVDLHREMLEKAVRRARRERLDIRFIQADVTALPFPDHRFDLVFVESVTIFTRWRAALAEYRRVLKPGGRLIDREMILCGRKTDLMRRRLKRFYGMRTLATMTEWKKRLKQSGFADVSVHEHSRSIGKWGVDHDPHRELDMALFEDEQVRRMSQTNDRLLARYGKKLGYAVLEARAPLNETEKG
ncbi:MULTISPECIES: class I SAM-dependent methyltransferase [Paenibacillus]|uniref:Methyltransferase domain-containing protein n=1 Tax=Paenibacillus xylanilyticus TaxID=248903 RepID=A0A7Y6BTI7_9BACL|nr:methyltransferase domain-containing protein [Paenibacillus xylanilyticus]NUU74579.1 methyltransferase domain-containing protein [Paenibacillus xylanilyticus]